MLEHQINVVITINEWMAQAIVESEFLQYKLAALPALELEISEQFSGINNGIENPLLDRLHQIVPLALANYGAGKANSKAVYDSLFRRISVDKGFIQQQMGKLTFKPFFKAIITNIRPYCQQLLVQGIDTPEMLQVIRHFEVDGISSMLFPVVHEDALASLAKAPEILVSGQQ